eukprot:XP_001691018.1 predicted protein [Chlamydomonas reinhardtii]
MQAPPVAAGNSQDVVRELQTARVELEKQKLETTSLRDLVSSLQGALAAEKQRGEDLSRQLHTEAVAHATLKAEVERLTAAQSATVREHEHMAAAHAATLDGSRHSPLSGSGGNSSVGGQHHHGTHGGTHGGGAHHLSGPEEERWALRLQKAERALEEERRVSAFERLGLQEVELLRADLGRMAAADEAAKVTVRAADDRARAAELVCLDAARTIGRLIDENNDLVAKINSQANTLSEYKSVINKRESELRALEQRLRQVAAVDPATLTAATAGAAVGAAHPQHQQLLLLPGGGATEADWKLVMLAEELPQVAPLPSPPQPHAVVSPFDQLPVRPALTHPHLQLPAAAVTEYGGAAAGGAHVLLAAPGGELDDEELAEGLAKQRRSRVGLWGWISGDGGR